jgi:hypothetical protein
MKFAAEEWFVGGTSTESLKHVHMRMEYMNQQRMKRGRQWKGRNIDYRTHSS